MFSSIFGNKYSEQHKSSKKKNKINGKSFIETINAEQGQKHRVIITHLLTMTLTRELETELLWIVAKGFDLPLVIGEQFICKTRKFQSASYHACLEFTLTTLFHEDFAQEIWLMLLSKLHDIEKCDLALKGLERKTRLYHLKKYENCFVGREAIDWLINYKFVNSRNGGINLGEIWWENRLIEHVTNSHSFKDDQLFYIFNEEEIIRKIKLIQQSRSKSNHFSIILKSENITEDFSNPNIINIDDMDSNQTMIRNKSNSAMNYKKHKKKRDKKQKHKILKKQKSNTKDIPIISKDNLYRNSDTGNQFTTNNNIYYGGSANTLIDEDSKIMSYMNNKERALYENEWSDFEKEQRDILSDSERNISINSPTNRNNKQHRKKRSISLPWFGN